MLEAWRGRRGRELAVAVAVLAVGALSVNLPLGHDATARAVMYRNMGATLAREGLPDEALRYFEKAVAANPAYIEGS